MRHNYLEIGCHSHWAVSKNGQGSVLVQLGDIAGEQVRLQLTPQQARQMANQLEKMAAASLSDYVDWSATIEEVKATTS